MSGAFSLTLTTTASTNVTLPTIGTLSTLAGTETLSAKTLTAPKIVSGGFIADANGNEQIIFTTVASAVNEITISNAATIGSPSIATTGGDSVIDLTLILKGTNAGLILNNPIKLNGSPSTDGTFSGPSTRTFNSGYSSTAVGDLVLLDSSATWQKTDANTASIYKGLLGIAMEVAASGSPCLVALPGSFIYCTAFPTLTVGGLIYMSETAGVLTQTAPTTTDSATRVIGHAVHADKIFFNPSGDYITHT